VPPIIREYVRCVDISIRGDLSRSGTIAVQHLVAGVSRRGNRQIACFTNLYKTSVAAQASAA
jgi:hypothetical protein